MYPLQLVLLLAASYSSSSGRVAPQYIPWKTENEIVSNVQLLQPVIASTPDESYSNIPSDAFTLDTAIDTKRAYKKDINKQLAALNRLHSDRELSRLLQQTGDDLYIIVVKQHDDKDDDDQTTGDDERQSSEYYTPADTIVQHEPHYYPPLPPTDDHKPRTTDDTYNKESLHSIYLSNDLNPADTFAADDYRHDLDRVVPKVFPSKFMMNSNMVGNNPEPLVVYVNKDLSASDNSNGLRSQNKVPLPMTVYVDKNDYRGDETDEHNTKTLEELIKEMHDSRYPKPIKVYITKEEPETETERDADAKHMKHLMHQIRALNKLLHGNNAAEPYTMYVGNQVGSGEDTPTLGEDAQTGRVERLASVGGDKEQAMCAELGAAFCAGDLQTSRREGEVRQSVDARRKGRPRRGRDTDLETNPRGDNNLWTVFNNHKEQLGQAPFVI